MYNEYSPKGKQQTLLVIFLGYLYIPVSLSSVLLFIVVLSWFSVMWTVPVHKKGALFGARMGLTFSNPIVSLTLYPLLSPGSLLSWTVFLYALSDAFAMKIHIYC
jgi:hypothetical protein